LEKRHAQILKTDQRIIRGKLSTLKWTTGSIGEFTHSYYELMNRATGAGMKYTDEEKLDLFLAAIPTGNDIRLEALMVTLQEKVDLTLEHAISRIHRLTELSRDSNVRSDEGTALFTKQRRDKCNNCGRQHDKGKCPAWKRECHNCGKTGHFAQACRKGNKRRDTTEEASVAFYATSKDKEIAFQAATKNPTELIVDTGASVHITGNVQHLLNIRELQNPIIIQGVGSTHLVRKVGDMQVRVGQGKIVSITKKNRTEKKNGYRDGLETWQNRVKTRPTIVGVNR
jgi:predicted  nucleic acid-binding Zn-ribbon protein